MKQENPREYYFGVIIQKHECGGCDFGKGHNCPNKINTIKNSPSKYEYINKGPLLPVYIHLAVSM